MVKPASEVADVALAADHQNGHLQGCAADGNEADRTLLLPRQGLAGKLQAIVADECGDKGWTSGCRAPAIQRRWDGLPARKARGNDVLWW